MEIKSVLVSVFLAGLFAQGHTAKILALFQFPGRSHFVMFEKHCKALAERGHEVTVLSHWPQKTPVPNYTDISVAGSMDTFFNNMTVEFVQSLSLTNLMVMIWHSNRVMCHKVLDHPATQELLRSSVRYDLIITEVYGVDCFLGLAHKWGVPFIGMISSSAFPWAYERVGNPDHPAYMPSYFLPYNGRMTFTERLWNTVLGQILSWGKYFFHDMPMQELSEKYFGPGLPPIQEIAKNTSLILVNSHFSFNQPTPTVPNLVEVGGLHIPQPRPLPEDLERYLNESTHGVVYFAMGSLVKADSFDSEKIESLLNAFSKLEQRVLMKIDPENIPPLPKNVLATKWMPQSDILRHPNIRLFITHGGLMSTQEAVVAGVPMVGIPLFADQYFNVYKCEALGIAVRLEYKDITANNVLERVNRVLSNESYSQNVRHLSLLFRDRPQSALDTAVFWTEYVIRHRGAHHLRTHAAHMPTYQYLLLDVLAFISLVIAIGVAVLWTVIRIFIHLCCKKSNSRKLKSS